MAETETEPLPALYFHCQTVYQAMLDDARPAKADDGTITMMVWEGFLTALFDKLNLSIPFFTSVRRELVRMGCIRQLRRGGGTAPSQWEIIKAPTEAAWNVQRPPNAKQLRKEELWKIQTDITTLSNRISLIEKALGIPVGAVLVDEEAGNG